MTTETLTREQEKIIEEYFAKPKLFYGATKKSLRELFLSLNAQRASGRQEVIRECNDFEEALVATLQ